MASCGGCNLCCDLMGVQMEPLEEGIKPAYVPCEHKCAGGCGVYEKRPTTCRTWECVWLATQHLQPTNRLPKALRPDKTRVVLEGNSQGTLVAHCEFGHEWIVEPMYSYLTQMARKGIVIVGHHENYQRLHANGQLEELVRLGVGENGEVTYIHKKDLAA